MNRFLQLILVLVFCSVGFAADVVDTIITTVNSEPILKSDLVLLKSKLKKKTLIDTSLLVNIDNNFWAGDEASLLKYLINQKILDSEVKRQNLSVTSERVEQEIKSIAKRNNASVEEIYSSLKQEGLTRSEYQESLKQKIEFGNLLENEIISKLRITDQEALAEYQIRNPNFKPSVFNFKLAHIYFDPKKISSITAEDRAVEVYSKLANSENFEKLAQSFSEDPDFSPGGILGVFKSGEFLPEVESLITNMKVGDFTKVIRSKKGFHIFKLLAKSNSLDPKFEKEKEKIKSILFEKHFQSQFKLWLAIKKEDATIINF